MTAMIETARTATVAGLGDAVTIIGPVPGHDGFGVVIDQAGQVLTVMDWSHRTVTVPSGGIEVEDSVLDRADVLTAADRRALRGFLPDGITGRTASFEDWCVAIAVARIEDITEGMRG